MRKFLGKYIKELSKAIDESSNIVLISHINPDGDAVGSMLGLFHYLVSREKNCSMISPNSLQEFLLWMNGVTNIIIGEDEPGRSLKEISNADLVVMIDFNHPSRIGNFYERIMISNAHTILIDHHPKPDIEADLIISEPSMSSTAEIIYELVLEIEKGEYINRAFTDSLYVGMMTDTGNFNYGTFDGETMRNVAGMLDSGLDKDMITDRVYNNFSSSRMRLLGFALLERMVVLENYRTAYIYLSLADLDRFGHVTGDTEGFVNMPLTIKGVMFSVLFIERDDHIKLSLRSKGSFEVNRFAETYFNGGGHRNAAGGRSAGDMKGCLEYFEKLLENYRKELSGDE